MFRHPRKIGKTKSIIMVMSFHVLRNYMCHYNPRMFIDVDTGGKFTVEKTILTNRMFFGGNHNWCDKRTGGLTSYDELAQQTDPISKIFHENLCAKIMEDGGDYPVILLQTSMGRMQGMVQGQSDSESL